ncbi:MAG: accessory factor UbiK family protein [Thiomargarita sp.]|nr:accessory factor UbiK family protein [Thiomargarita sp.]
MSSIPNFDNFFKTFTETLPKGFLNLHQDIEKNLRVALDASLRKMNLITREEFEVHIAVLNRTRAKLEQLEKQIATQQTNNSNSTS